MPLPAMADPNSLIYAYHDPADLPDWCRALLDPAQAVPAEVIHVERDFGPNPVFTAFLAIPFALALIFTAIDAAHHRIVWKEWCALFPIFTLPFVWSWLHDRKLRRLRDDITAGRLRMGLFLTPAALLLSMTPKRCTMVPLQFITRFDKSVLNPGRANSRSTYQITGYYQLGANENACEKSFSFECPGLIGFSYRDEELLDVLNRWLTNGRAGQETPNPTAPKRAGQSTAAHGEAANRLRLEQQARLKQSVIDAEKMQAAPHTIAPVFLPNGELKTTWERTTEDGYFYSFGVSACGSVTSYEKFRNYTQSESAGSVSFDEFLSGQYQSLAVSQFGTSVLEEIIAAVYYLKAHPPAPPKPPPPQAPKKKRRRA